MIAYRDERREAADRGRGAEAVGVSTAATGTPPAALPVDPSGIPPELAERPQWVCWRWEPRQDKPGDWTKVPINPRTGGRASATEPTTWGALAAALAFADAHGLPGVGFVVTVDDPFTGIDLDDCRDPDTGAVAPWAAEVVAAFDSYAEVTPSGTGLRVWIVGSVVGLLEDGKTGTRRGQVEVYSAKRYFTVTGHRLERGRG